MFMANTKPIPIRLSFDTIARLEAAAKKIGNSSAGITRFCIETWLKHFEATGEASLPVNWEKLLAEQDGRTVESRSALNDKPSSIVQQQAEKLKQSKLPPIGTKYPKAKKKKPGEDKG